MTKFYVELSDTITVDRWFLIEVEADDEEAACTKAMDDPDSYVYTAKAQAEDQVDASLTRLA